MEAIVYNFNIMRSLSKKYLEKASGDACPDCTTSLLYSAFSLEAYLNYSGDRLFECWSEIEKGLSPVTKIKLICEQLNLELDFSRRPLQTVKRVFDLRNLVVHPKAELAEGDFASVDNLPQPVWEQLSTIELAQRAIEDFGKLIYSDLGGLDIENPHGLA